MLKYLFGFACLLGVGAVLKHKACHHGFPGGAGGYHGWHHGGWPWGPPSGDGCEPGGPHGGRGGWSFWSHHRRHFQRHLFRWLGTTVSQEKELKATLNELHEAVASAKHDFWLTRSQLAAIFRGETFDETLVSGVVSRHDEALARVRAAAVNSLGKIYETLDPGQRTKVADWLERGSRWGCGHP